MGEEGFFLENEKKSFLFYFDNYPMVQALPPEQRGWLLSALCVYADGVWRDETLTMEQVLEGFPRMDRETRVACAFLGGTILRDTKRWLNQRRNRQAWKEEAGHTRSRQAPRPPSEEDEEKAREDMERMRRLVERMKLSEGEEG